MPYWLSNIQHNFYLQFYERLKAYYGYEYCTLCDKKFKDKRYLKIHATRLCPFLTVVERVKCRLCGKVYLQDKTYRDHLTKHTKVERYQCARCGKKFAHQNSHFRHDKVCK